MVRLISHASEHVLLNHALDEIAGFVDTWPDRRVFLIVPEASKADAERRYLESSRAGGLLMAEVLSFKRLAFRLFAEVGGLAVKRLTSTGRAVLIGKLLLSKKEHFRRFGALRQKPGFALQLSSLLEEFSRFMVGKQDLEMAAAEADLPRAKERFADLATLYDLVETSRDASDFVDGSTDSRRLIDLLQNNRDPRLDFLAVTDVYVAGFGELTPFTSTEVALLKALAARVSRVTVLLPDGPGPSYLHAFCSRALLQKALSPDHSVLAKAAPLPVRDPTFSFTESAEDEARLAAGEIRRLLTETSLRRRDIAIGLCRPADSVILADVLRAFQVPSFLDEASDIRWTPFSRYMDALLAISQRKDDLDQVMGLLSNPLSGLDQAEADRFENACLSLGLRRLPAMLDRKRQPTDKGGCQAFDRCLPLLGKVQAVGSAMRQARNGRGKVDVLLGYLRDEPALFDRLETDIAFDRDKDFQLQATAAARAVNEWQDRLIETADILGTEVISQAHFCQLMTESIFRLEVKQIPIGIDRVRVAPLRQIVHYPAKILFVLGVSADYYPVGDEPATFLSSEERRHLATLLNGRYPDGREQHRLTGAALDRKVRSLPSQALFFSTPDGQAVALPIGLKLDQGWKKRTIHGNDPDLHWNHVGEAKRRLQGLSQKEKQSLSVASWQAGLDQALGHPFHGLTAADNCAAERARVSKSALELALVRRPVKSVSRIQLYNSCPYQFFARALLGLQDRDLGIPDAAVQGEFMHNVLKEALQPLLYDQSDIAKWRAGLADGGQAMLEADATEKGRAKSLRFAGNDVRVVARLSRSIAANLDRIAYLYEHEGVRPVALEYNFGEPDSQGLRLEVDGTEYRFSGVIDRVDRYRDGRDVLVDYKRGDHTFDRDAFEAGTDIQLPFYENAWSALDQAHVVRGSYYQTLKEYKSDIRPDKIGFEPLTVAAETHVVEVEKRIEKQVGLAEKAMDIAVETIKNIATGNIPAAPCVLKAGQSPCRYCAFKVACRLDGLSDREKRALGRRGRDI